MIRFVNKPDPLPLPVGAEENRFEHIRKAAAEQHKRSDADGTRRRTTDLSKAPPEEAASK